MPHNPPIFPPILPDHYVVTPSRLEALDQLASESLDGVNGGTCAPTTPIRIGGAGLDLRGSSRLRGPIATGRDAVGITLSNHAYPAFVTPRTRTIMISLVPLFDTDTDTDAIRAFEHQFEPIYGIKATGTSQFSIGFGIPTLRLHDGATIVSATLCWRSGAVVASLAGPTDAAELPQARLIRAKKEGLETADYTPTNIAELWKVPARVNSTAYAIDDIVHSTGGGNWEGSNGYTYRCVQAGVTAAAQPVMSTTIGGDTTDGTVIWRTEYGHNNPFLHYQWPGIPSGAAPAAVHNVGLPQDLKIRVNMNTTIDTATYSYRLELLEPGGAGGVSYGNVYHSLLIELAGLTELREP